MEKNKLIDDIQNINQIIENNSTINLNNFESMVKINFNSGADMAFENFIKNNISHRQIYVSNDYKIHIDIIEENFDIYLFFISCLEYSNEKINTSKYSNLIKFKNEWNFCICYGIMFNFPFTIDKYIYMPYEYIKKCYDTGEKNKLICTLIHEKIHIGQRFYELEWETYINKNDTNWIKVYESDEIFKLINEKINNNSDIIDLNKYAFVVNPDTFYSKFKYVYLIDDDNFHYGHYIYEIKTKKIRILYFVLDLKNKHIKITDKIANNNNEHPYEFYAYKISDEITFS